MWLIFRIFGPRNGSSNGSISQMENNATKFQHNFMMKMIRKRIANPLFRLFYRIKLKEPTEKCGKLLNKFTTRILFPKK